MKIPVTGYVMNKFEVLGIVGEGKLKIYEPWKAFTGKHWRIGKDRATCWVATDMADFQGFFVFFVSVKAIFTFFHKAAERV